MTMRRAEAETGAVVCVPLCLQWAATRHDLFAHDVCEALEKLHTQAPAHSFRCEQSLFRQHGSMGSWCAGSRCGGPFDMLARPPFGSAVLAAFAVTFAHSIHTSSVT